MKINIKNSLRIGCRFIHEYMRYTVKYLVHLLHMHYATYTENGYLDCIMEHYLGRKRNNIYKHTYIQVIYTSIQKMLKIFNSVSKKGPIKNQKQPILFIGSYFPSSEIGNYNASVEQKLK